MSAANRIEQLPPPAPDGYRVAITHDGTRAGCISAFFAFLATSPPEASAVAFIFDGELITLDAAMARATTRN